jgi:hypothetical protein
MLGELISETTGKRIVRRVLSTDPLKVEVSFEDAGILLGTPVMGFGTYVAVAGPDGSVRGEGEGASATAEGELITWKGAAQGKIRPGGAISYRGILFFRTTSAKLARLNDAPGVFEYEIDPEGKTHSKVWEWK